VDVDGAPGFVLSDPLRLSGDPVVLTPAALRLLQLADGKRTLRDIQVQIARTTGNIVQFEQIEGLFSALDEKLLLDGPRSREAFEAARAEFHAIRSRPAALAGQSYPDDRAELRAFLDELFSGPKGPGKPAPSAVADDLKALVAPHIDLRRGGAAFAHAYKALAESPQPEVFVILGIAHSGDGRPYTLTEKDFETPLGTVRTDRELVRRLTELAPAESLGDEFVHRNEHSIEFQTILLRYLYPDGQFSIVPILCGSLHEALLEKVAPTEKPEVAGFIQALGRVIEGSGKRVCVIAAVDLAHVGGRFGDRMRLDAGVLRWVEAEDRAMLAAVTSLDAQALFRSIEKDHDRRHVCGYPALYTMLSLFERNGVGAPRSGELLRYEQSVEPETGSAVTFASLAFR